MKNKEMFIPLSKTPEKEISCFETMRSYNGKILGLEEHITRLQESSKTLGFSRPLDREELKQQIFGELKNFGKKNAVVRPTVFRSTIKFFVSPLPKIEDRLYRKGIEVKTSPTRLPSVHAAPVGAKSNWYGPQALSYLTHLRKCFEVIYLDNNGFVGEHRINNIFMVKDNVLKTPPAVHILNGVTRRLMIDLARSIPIETEETFLTRHELFNADECFLTNSVLEAMPIVKIDGRTIGKGKPGQVTQQLRQLYQERIKGA